MILILLGPPGSGKGTVSERLAQEFNFFHLSPGELLREEVAKGTTLSQEIKKYIEKGRPLPDQFVVEIVKLELSGKKKIILDGFPRSLAQAQELSQYPLKKVILLDMPEKEVIERLAGRRTCPKNHGYHLKSLPPQKAGICDYDDLPLTARQDDRPSVIRERFRAYHQQTLPVIAYYEKKRLLARVDAGQSPERVYLAVKKIVSKSMRKIKKREK